MPSTDVLARLALPTAVLILFYFVLIRPQSQRERQRKKLIESLEKGQKIVTLGGIYGTVVGFKRKGEVIKLRIADNTIIEVDKDAIDKAADEDE